jgi:hypothetical protein
MANALGRISGQLLKDNLTRNGEDLKFDEFGLIEPVLKLNVTNRYISINSDATSTPLLVAGRTLTSDLIISSSLIGISSFKISAVGNTITSSQDLNLSAATQVFANIIDTDNIRIDNNVISTKTLNTTLDFTPAGSLDIYNNLHVTGNLWARETTPASNKGNITLDGNITFGSDNNDTISFNADVDTDILPNVNELYTIGATSQKWEGLYTTLINGEQILPDSIVSGGINLASLQGNIWYVATNGSDVLNPENTQGKHQNAPFASIQQALNFAVAGDTVYIYPGTYTEVTPLTVPAGVTIVGTGIRAVTVIPSVATDTKTVFLMNGESTISDLSVKDFYAPGYAFAFAPGFTVTARSPYIQNVTVITHGSVTSPTDPRGFDQGDAGGGAIADGSLAQSSSKEASMLFHSVTFITPGVDALVMTNGVRIEWLDSFIYFANRGLYATNGLLGFAGLGTKFGAEMRSIGSANVYGNYGAEADGSSTLIYLINHNFAYIGAGKDATNDSHLNIAVNETIELAGGKIYYQSLDNKGNFRVGDAFSVSFETGLVEFNGVSVSAFGVTSINFASGTDETIVNSAQITTGNVKFSSNTLTTLVGAINFAGGTNEIKLNANTDVTDNLSIVGNFNIDGKLTIGNAYIDIVRFTAPVEFDLRPVSDDDFTLGSSTNKSWDFVYLDTGYIGNYKLENATISTLPVNADIELRANSTGKIYIPTNNVEINNDLTVNGTTSLKNTVIGTAVITTSPVQNVAGSISATGFFFLNGWLTHPGTNIENVQVGWTCVQLPGAIVSDVNISAETITITGDVFTPGVSYTFTGSLPATITHIGDYYQTGNTLQTGNRTITGTLAVTNNIYFDNIHIVDNRIFTTNLDDNLELRAAGTTGKVIFNDNTQFSQNALFGTLESNGLTNSGIITSDIFTNNDIEINDNYITTTVGNNNLIFTANGAGITKLEKLNFSATTFSTVSNNDNIILSVPLGSVIIDAASALKVPRGTTLNRPTMIQSDFRFSTTEQLYKGFNTANVTFGGVYSANTLTNVLAHPTNNTISFTTNNAVAMTLSATGFALAKVTVDNNLEFSTNSILTNNTNSSIFLTPDGTGNVIIDDWGFSTSEIINQNLTSPILFQNTGDGYLAFSGTSGLVIPAGDIASQPVSPELGDLRYNTELEVGEIFNGIEYRSIAETGGSLITEPEAQDISALMNLIFG